MAYNGHMAVQRITCAYQKIKTAGVIRGRAQHNAREHGPHEKNDEDYNLAGGTTSDQVMADWRRRMETVNKTIRKDAVKAVEFVIQAGTEENGEIIPIYDQKAFFKKATEYIQNRYGKENILQATVHMTEKSPHLHILAAPVTSDQRLNAKSFMDGPIDLRALHDDLAEIGKEFGLRRGLRGGHRNKVSLDKFYGHVYSAVTPPEKFRGESGKEYTRRLENEVAKLKSKGQYLLYQAKDARGHKEAYTQIEDANKKLKDEITQERREMKGEMKVMSTRIDRQEKVIEQAREVLAFATDERIEVARSRAREYLKRDGITEPKTLGAEETIPEFRPVQKRQPPRHQLDNGMSYD